MNTLRQKSCYRGRHGRTRENHHEQEESKGFGESAASAGYRRYESPEALALLQTIYADLRLHVNYFQPLLKLLAKQGQGSKVRKQYDLAKTPHQRVMTQPGIPIETKIGLQTQYLQLNPAVLQRSIEANLRQLWTLPW